MINKLNNPTNNTKKYYIFSGHDETICPLLASLNFTSAQCIFENFFPNLNLNELIFVKNKPIFNCASGEPYFASQIIFELHKN